MATVIDELVTILGIDVNSSSFQSIKRMSDGLNDIAKTAAKVGAAITAAASSALYLAERLNQTTAGIGNFSQITGISTKNVQALGVAVEMIGGNFQSLQSDLMSLTKSMSSPVPGEFNQTLFQLGINVRRASGELKTADDVLLDVADRFKGMSSQEQLQWGSKLGFSNDTIRLLQAGSGEIERLKREAENLPTIVGEKNIKNAQLFVEQFSLLRRMLLFVGQEAASFAGPALQGIVQDMTEWLKKNREIIESKLQHFIEGAVQGFKDFWKELKKIKDNFEELFPNFTKFIKRMDESKATAVLVEGALTALGLGIGVLVVGYAPLIAIVVLAGLVMNDFIAYMEGAPSVIGDMITWIDKLAKKLEDEFPTIARFVKMLGGIGESTSLLGRFLSGEDDIEKESGVSGGAEKSGPLSGVRSGAATGSLADRQRKGMEYFMSQGLSKEQAAGIMGNLQWESAGLNSGAREKGGSGFGLAQWTSKSRREGLEAYAKSKGASVDDFDTQLEYVMKELRETRPGAYQKLLQAKTPEEAAMIISKFYESPNAALAHNDKRIGMAYSNLQSLNTASVPGGGGSTTNHSTVNITNNIHGSDADQIAQKTTNKMNYQLQQNYPGGLAPAVG